MGWVKERVAVVVAVVMGLLAVSASVAGCAGAEQGRSRGAGERAVASAEVGPPRIPSATGLPGHAVGVGFAADGSGFALLADCSKTRCVQRVAVLDKGAAAWRLGTSPLPDVTGDLGITAGLVALGPGRALITEGEWPPPGRTWFTGDGGASWRQSTDRARGTTPTVPEGGALVQDCTTSDEDGDDCARTRLLAVLPDTGEYRVLANQPPLKGVVTPAGRIGARLYAAGLDPSSGHPALAVSEDGGGSWRKSELPGGPKGWNMSVVSDGSALYAAHRGQLLDEDDVKNGLLAIHRSTDGGHTWEQVWKHRKGVEPRSILGAPIAATDGSLTIHGEDGVWRSTDSGRSLTRLGGRGPQGWVTTTPLGYLWGDSFGAGRYRISADGVRWTTFDLGADS
ncbi:sialidase family protein [Streptomyces sp. S.PB5]|uniref:WD40/YVTN/BNR-like repeat-containing protein n=1 Tax=Streptomyces sp. S.PB5 TaxID=3020844 RepID=UPI0025B1295F|nr:sialidase family protein [Streptomyces sp. S.PB5]MDN3026292.1 sialidase family protein [Streptomyces sp. S.PB5]